MITPVADGRQRLIICDTKVAYGVPILESREKLHFMLDAVDIEQAVPQLASWPGTTYTRLLRGAVPRILDDYDYRFELRKAKLVRPGQTHPSASWRHFPARLAYRHAAL
ncbi:hypothetical protein [Actinoallomurus sp. CA-150999]|uniref:hypothetical protein n=1 Tax=Actinoallomurus sp. CA-150999 TaxID=3239887 RepID=UPI003D8F5053